MAKQHHKMNALALASLEGEQFLTACYQQILGRTPDVQGRTHYLRMLGNGHSKISIICSIASSPEARARNEQISLLWLLRADTALMKIPALGRIYSAICLLCASKEVLRSFRVARAGGNQFAREASNDGPTTSLPEMNALLNSLRSHNAQARDFQRRLHALEERYAELAGGITGSTPPGTHPPIDQQSDVQSRSQ